jgi:D-3-phosphoglycerate dehydrogenase
VRIFNDAAPALEKVVANLHDADIIVPIRERTEFTRDLIGALPRLKLISQTGRSTHHVDLAACTERGIAVAAGTHASPYTVAEHTWTLILAAVRHIPQETALMKRGEFRRSFSVGLHGRTLGIFGLGKIGGLGCAAAGRATRRPTCTKTSPCCAASTRSSRSTTRLCTPHSAWLEKGTYEL